MKLFKITLIALSTLLMTNCDKSERSIGMTTWSDDGTEYKYHLGTEDALSVVKNYDEFFNTSQWNKAIEIFADTATITYYNGQKVTPKELIEMSKVRDSNFIANDIDYKWNLQSLFSVDLDPTTGGEHVSADYSVTYDDGEEQMEFNSILRFYVIDGKIIGVNQYNQSVIAE